MAEPPSNPTPPREVYLLFVCTGNTCRSPMAQAIALHLLMEKPPQGIKVHVSSAGTNASHGAYESDENIVALKSAGIKGLDDRRHRSQPLTPQLILRSTAVYVMTVSHAKHAQAMAQSLGPEHSKKVIVLDPEGHDVPDPVGRGPDVYRQTAEKLLQMIQKRLTEIILDHSGAALVSKSSPASVTDPKSKERKS